MRLENFRLPVSLDDELPDESAPRSRKGVVDEHVGAWTCTLKSTAAAPPGGTVTVWTLVSGSAVSEAS
jgi:hypothetical protein